MVLDQRDWSDRAQSNGTEIDYREERLSSVARFCIVRK